MFEDPSAFVASQKKNLASCLEEEQYIEAFRAARFLLQATRDCQYLKQMEQILEHCAKKQFHVAYRFLDYQFRPSPKRKALLERIIRRYPYADLAWKSQAEMAKHDAARGRARRIRGAMAVARRMTEGLEARHAASFTAQPQYRALLDMARAAGMA